MGISSMTSTTGRAVRRRVTGVLVAGALVLGGSVATATSASAANAWTSCITPYQSAWNSTSGKVSDLIFHIGFANCAAKLANQAWNAGDVDLYAHYYGVWRTHYAAASVVGGQVAIDAWAKLSRFGIKKGLSTL
ncbi:hypothetical protein OMK64_00740 [Cellulomonas fimi]|uniref:hypothetical protein n=1 Tax=Cellulomonas fimi TaxID=1708 RepID=UPI00234CB3FF|nr:hypothetical protein [Cellulomonas fimi]MDC7120059.1 hypothetical protein [Cellulomonas fimi]